MGVDEGDLLGNCEGFCVGEEDGLSEVGKADGCIVGSKLVGDGDFVEPL